MPIRLSVRSPDAPPRFVSLQRRPWSRTTLPVASMSGLTDHRCPNNRLRKRAATPCRCAPARLGRKHGPAVRYLNATSRPCGTSRRTTQTTTSRPSPKIALIASSHTGTSPRRHTPPSHSAREPKPRPPSPTHGSWSAALHARQHWPPAPQDSGTTRSASNRSTSSCSSSFSS